MCRRGINEKIFCNIIWCFRISRTYPGLPESLDVRRTYQTCAFRLRTSGLQNADGIPTRNYVTRCYLQHSKVTTDIGAVQTSNRLFDLVYGNTEDHFPGKQACRRACEVHYLFWDGISQPGDIIRNNILPQ